MIQASDIITDQNPLIRTISQEVPMPISDEDRQTVLDMLDYLKLSQDEEKAEELGIRPGVGLAAIQIGIAKRMCAIYCPRVNSEGEVTAIDAYALVNPKIISYTPKPSYLANGEGCLSVPEDVAGKVPRHAKVTVTGFDALTDQNVKIVARGFLSIVLQHELDHFDGILYYDRMNKDNPDAPIPNALIIE